MNENLALRTNAMELGMDYKASLKATNAELLEFIKLREGGATVTEALEEPPSKISYQQLITEHEFDADSVAHTLTLLRDTDHLFLYRNQMFDSRCFGRQHLLMVGPGRTANDSNNPPKEVDPDNCGGLPSRREQLIGEVDLDDVRRSILEGS